MTIYVLRRLLLMIPTLFGIMVLNFLIIQAAPGGPVEQAVARLKGNAVSATERFSGAGDLTLGAGPDVSGGAGVAADKYRGARGIDPELIQRLEREYGFDKPLWERFWHMMGRYAFFDFGQSFYRDRSVMGMVAEKLPVSISLGVWTTLLTYLIAIPLGIRKAVRDGSSFDVWTSTAVVIGYAIPSFLFAILLIVLFAGGGYVQWFPLRGLVSPGWDGMPWPQKILDYLWHMTLPVTAMLVGGFASLTMLTKNSFLEEIRKTYVLTARAKGLSENGVLYGHVFRNAMLIVIAGFPGALVRMLFTGAMLIEVIFSLDGMGLLGFESAVNRDYPVMFGTLYVFTLLGLFLALLGDLLYVAVDPRIDFEGRAA